MNDATVDEPETESVVPPRHSAYAGPKGGGWRHPWHRHVGGGLSECCCDCCLLGQAAVYARAGVLEDLRGKPFDCHCCLLDDATATAMALTPCIVPCFPCGPSVLTLRSIRQEVRQRYGIEEKERGYVIICCSPCARRQASL